MDSETVLDKVSQRKRNSFVEARAMSLPVLSRERENVSLVPIGPWILTETEIIHLMARWRSKAMPFFFSQFEATPESMADYLEHFSIKQPNRLLFLIFVEDQPIGHIGLSEINPESAVLDNMIRGESIGPSDLMLGSENQLISWSFDHLKLKGLSLEIQSRNFLAKRLHYEMGFVIAESVSLRRIKRNGEIRLVACSSEEATEKFNKETMTLRPDYWSRKAFLRPEATS